MKFVVGFLACYVVLFLMCKSFGWGQEDTVKQCHLSGSFTVHDKVYRCATEGGQ
ncbi:hypothetical protein LMG33818_000022 [Halomonadaceae bacterium LMG 33818]